jgi:hypothetical protein
MSPVLVAHAVIAIHDSFASSHDVSMGDRTLIIWFGEFYCYCFRAMAGCSRWAAALRFVTSLGLLMSMTYGVTAALTLNEFALWLNLRDVYSAREGRALKPWLFQWTFGDGPVRPSFFHGTIQSATTRKPEQHCGVKASMLVISIDTGGSVVIESLEVSLQF